MYIILTLVSMVFSAIGDILGKEVANEKIKTETMFINTYLLLGIFKVILVLITAFSAFVFRIEMLLLLIPNIIMSSFITNLYLKSLKKLPVSVVVPVYLLYYPISMLFSIGLLKEQVSSVQLVAIVVIFLMILMLSFSTSKSRLNRGSEEEHLESVSSKMSLHMNDISKGLVFIVTAGLLNGILVVLDKNAFNMGLTVNEMLLFGGISQIIIAFFMYFKMKNYYNKKGDRYNYVVTKLMVVKIGISFLAGLTYTAAMKTGNATIVVPIHASSIFLVEILSSIFLNEKLKKFDYLCILIFMTAILVLIL